MRASWTQQSRPMKIRTTPRAPAARPPKAGSQSGTGRAPAGPSGRAESGIGVSKERRVRKGAFPGGGR
eukprot:5710417-Pyramimonas_sp.AAC.1